MEKIISLNDIALFSKGEQINNDNLLKYGKYYYLNGGINPSGKWNDFNVEGDTVAISEGGNSCGYINFMTDPFWCGAHCYYLYNIKCNPKYLYYVLKANQKKIMKLRSGACMPNIKKNDLGDFKFKYNDDKKIQNDIIIQFEKLESIITKTKTLILLLDNLVKSRFVEMFGEPDENPFDWGKKSLTEIVENANNGMARRGNDEDGNIVLRLVELQDGYIDYSSPNRIMLNENEKKRYLLNENDFLFARVNGNPDNVGRCAVFHDIGEDVYHNDHIIRVHFNIKLLEGTFASFLLNSEYGKRQLKKQIKTSAGQYTISQEGIGAINTILPPLELQNQFADFVKQVDKSKFVE